MHVPLYKTVIHISTIHLYFLYILIYSIVFVFLDSILFRKTWWIQNIWMMNPTAYLQTFFIIISALSLKFVVCFITHVNIINVQYPSFAIKNRKVQNVLFLQSGISLFSEGWNWKRNTPEKSLYYFLTLSFLPW